MNHKKIIAFSLVLFLIGISFLNLAKNGKCNTYTYVWYFNVDKTTYYNDELIYVNASWDLDYNDGEMSYVQLKIFDENWDLLWNSSIYDQKGFHLEGEWYVKITDLPLPFNNTSNWLIVVFYYYLNTGSVFTDFVEIRYANTIKRNITCELTDFTPSFIYGDIFDFTAKFFYSENDSVLSNYMINVKIKSNSIITFNKNFTTDPSGLIYVSIPNDNLTIGKNTLLFDVMENIFHYNSSQEYQLSINIPTESSNSNEKNSKNNDLSVLINSIISLVSILSVLFLFFLYAYLKKKKIHIPAKDIITN